jgi:DNA invertase Pin-like site-specific DNA recombinase
MKVALYARVSTDDKEQNPETQLLALRNFCTDMEWEISGEYVDMARAKDYKRRLQWQQLRKDARMRKFKIVLVFRLDRAFRSVRECLNTLEEWKERGIAFKSLREDVIDTSSSMGNFMIQVLAAVAELESSMISDRVTAGMARAKSQGKQLGRPPVTAQVGFHDHYKTILERLRFGDISKRKAAQELHIGYPTLKRLLDGEHVSQK